MAISDAIDLSAVARVLGIKTEFVNLLGGAVVLLPQRVALVGQGSSVAVYSNDKARVTSAVEVGNIYGFGSPLHLAAQKLLPANGDGLGTIPLTVYPLDDDGAGVASAGDITPSGAQTEAASYVVRVNNIDSQSFVIPVGATVAARTALITAAINAELDLPITAIDNATVVNTLAKWEGASSNGIVIEVIGSATAGTAFAITQHTGGLVNPDVDDALALVGNVWETMIINCMDVADTATLNKFQVFGDGRYGALVRKPPIVFVGNTEVDPNAAIVISDARKTDKINSQLVEPGSNDLPFVVVAREISRIAVRANNNPPFDYGSLQATGLVPGADGDQWDYTERDLAVKGGSSTIEVKDGVVNISDTVTMYHPSGDPTPAYRYVVDVVKLQNIIFNLDLIFSAPEWDGAPLIPDDQATSNPAAKKPKSAIAAVAALIDSLALNAIISDPETAKGSILAGINETNPKRLDLSVTVQLAGNTNIISVDLDFGFFFGTPQVVA